MAEKTKVVKILLKNKTAQEWQVQNPVLGKGELGIENDTSKFKFGDGTNAWNDLPYANLTPEEAGDLGQGDMLKSVFAQQKPNEGYVDKAVSADKVGNALTIHVGEEDFTFDGSAATEVTVSNTEVTDSSTNGNIVVDGSEVEVYDDSYTNSTPTVNAIGGIAAGTTFDKMSYTDLITKLLYPYVQPVVTLKTNPDNGCIAEMGDWKTVTSATVSIVKKSNSIVSVTLKKPDGSVVETKTDGVADGGTIQFTGFSEIVNQTGQKFTCTVNDGEKDVTVSSGTFTYVYPYFSGVVANDAEINEATVEALTKDKSQKGTKTKSFTTNNQKCVFAYPASYGDLTKIEDQNKFDNTGAFTKQVVSITGLDNTPQNYNVYVSNNASTVTGFSYTFSI